ncbi:MAG: hypothetical protein ABS62_00345 [Microbacterium sp. SCN 70-200]|uniref:LysR family transcriptional regulator n=1 Tax=unclassified Microbacterium TaxID=2609290 RepID=UPI00086CCB90|nr:MULTISPECIES: LysR family transcriptional regulator [unclassified Microbacterium]MBN9215030.1 LysR family transcriptional regulator [Microbacterium sp.]ODT42883.1 MAG: hypothetical protein ABS62_00345 [Microbacterium sp. SCN 70-200]OJV84810.1 MAG: hypothetical protein BGO46_05405 [Microbacterium sp. 70-16]
MDDLRGIDLNLLVVLDAILTERNLTRAGETIGMTQPAVSSAATKLRRMLDDPLLIRSGRTSELTERGAALQPIVRQAMEEIGRTLGVRPMFDPLTTTRRFRFTASDYALAFMTAPLMEILEQEAPHASVEFAPMNALEPIDLLREDIVIASAAREVPGKHQALFSDTMVCIVRRGHPRLQDGALSAADLSDLPYVQVVFADGVVMFADDALSAAGVLPRTARTVPGFLPVPWAVAGTDMFGFVPERVAALYADELDLVTATIPIALPVLVEAAYWHPSRTGDPAVSWLLGILRTVAERVEFAGEA